MSRVLNSSEYKMSIPASIFFDLFKDGKFAKDAKDEDAKVCFSKVDGAKASVEETKPQSEGANVKALVARKMEGKSRAYIKAFGVNAKISGIVEHVVQVETELVTLKTDLVELLSILD